MLLQDVLVPGLRIVFCGTALGTRSARVGAYYAGRGNQFWTTLFEVGLTPRVVRPEEYRSVLDFGIGLTDVCKTRAGSDEEVGSGAFDVPRLRAAIERCSPAWIAFNGKNAARAAIGDRVSYGEQPEFVPGVRCYVLPSTSGAARGYWDVALWRDLVKRLPDW